VVSLKDFCGFSSFTSHGRWSSIFVPPQTNYKVTFKVCAVDSASERNRFLVLTEMYLLINGVKDLV
jgi:hypothetical protein